MKKDGNAIIAGAGAAVRRLNPHLYEPKEALKRCEAEKERCNKRVAELVRTQSEPNRASGSQNSGVVRSAAGLGYSVLIVSYRKRLLDSHDNCRAAHKQLVDRITEWLGFKSDADPRLEWNYEQVKTKAATGTHVLITHK